MCANEPNYFFVDNLFKNYLLTKKSDHSIIQVVYNNHKKEIISCIEKFFEFIYINKLNESLFVESDLHLQINRELIFEYWNFLFNEIIVHENSDRNEIDDKFKIIISTQNLFIKYLAIHKRINEDQRDNWDMLRCINDLNYEKTIKIIISNLYRRFSLSNNQWKDINHEELAFIINYVVKNNLKDCKRISIRKILEQIKVTFNLHFPHATFYRICQAHMINLKEFQK